MLQNLSWPRPSILYIILYSTSTQSAIPDCEEHRISLKYCTSSSFTAPADATEYSSEAWEITVKFLSDSFPHNFFVLFLVFLCSVMQSGIQRKCGREQGKSGSLQRDVQILEYFRIWVSIRKDSFCFSFSKSDSISCEASLHASDTLRTWILSVKLGGHPKVFLQKLWSWFKSHLLPLWVCCLY